jgi:pilus assembly protein CpaF
VIAFALVFSVNESWVIHTKKAIPGELMSDVVADLVEQVRHRVRMNDSSLQINNVVIEHAIEDAIAESEVFVTASELTQPANQTKEQALLQLSGLGQLQPFLDDPTVEEIWINEPSRIFVARNGIAQLTNLILTELQVRTLVERMLTSSGRRVDLANPFVDATLEDGSRLHVAIPDITRKFWAVNIRKFVMGSKSLNGLVKASMLTRSAADFLTACVMSGLNIVVAGATQAGKTTLMNALLNSARSSDRVITCEEVFELQLDSPDWIALQTRQESLEGTGDISLRRLIKEALRMRPSRLIVGEVRQEECLDLLVAMNAGMPAMCSIHANSAEQAIEKMCLLPMLAGSNVSAEFVKPTVASVVDIVVHLSMNSAGVRKVQQIVSVTGRFENNSIETIDLFSITGNELLATGHYPAKSEKFRSNGFDLEKILSSQTCQ